MFRMTQACVDAFLMAYVYDYYYDAIIWAYCAPRLSNFRLTQSHQLLLSFFVLTFTVSPQLTYYKLNKISLQVPFIFLCIPF